MLHMKFEIHGCSNLRNMSVEWTYGEVGVIDMTYDFIPTSVYCSF